MKSYAVVCRELPDREQAAREHFHARGVAAAWWYAAHGKTWGLETALEYDPGKHLPSGHVSLNVSTWFLWQHALNQADGLPMEEPVAFYEDDCCFPEDYHRQRARLFLELDVHFPDWDLVFLGLAEREPHVWHKVTDRIGPPDSKLCRLNDPFGTHAYMARKRALPVLLEHMRAAHRNLDQQLWERVLKPGRLNWCAVLPSLVTQRTFDYGAGKPEWVPSCVGPGDVDRPDEVFGEQPGDPDRPGLRGNPREIPHVLGVVTPAPVDLPGRPSEATIHATNKLVDPFPCIYRGEMLEDDGRDAANKPVPLSQCARLNVPCHSKAGRAVTDPRDTRACESCSLRTPMIPPGVRPRLPIPDGHFNPSLAVFNGKLILATRDSWGHSKVALWELTNSRPDWSGGWTPTPIGSFASGHPQAPRLEDPRLFVMPDQNTGRDVLCAMFNLPDGYPPKLVQVGYCRFAPDLSGITHTEVYKSPQKNVYEKNWVPFHDADGLHWVYSTKPDHLVLGEYQNWSTPNPLPWTGGVIRGGASPVLVRGAGPNGRDAWYHFFHGCLKRVQGSVYTMGCTVFDAAPPYQVLRQTPTPLMWPDEKAHEEEVVKRYVLWPGGAVSHAGHWHVALGIDDSYSRVVRVPFDLVEKALSAEPGEDRVVSIRDTALALGTHAGE